MKYMMETKSSEQQCQPNALKSPLFEGILYGNQLTGGFIFPPILKRIFLHPYNKTLK